MASTAAAFNPREPGKSEPRTFENAMEAELDRLRDGQTSPSNLRQHVESAVAMPAKNGNRLAERRLGLHNVLLSTDEPRSGAGWGNENGARPTVARRCGGGDFLGSNKQSRNRRGLSLSAAVLRLFLSSSFADLEYLRSIYGDAGIPMFGARPDRAEMQISSRWLSPARVAARTFRSGMLLSPRG
jgi:hypothetical protein